MHITSGPKKDQMILRLRTLDWTQIIRIVGLTWVIMIGTITFSINPVFLQTIAYLSVGIAVEKCRWDTMCPATIPMKTA